MGFIYWSNFRIPRNSFTCHWIRIASIVLCLDLQSLPTHVSEADQSCGVFWSLAHLFSHFYMSGSNLKHFKLQKHSGRDCRRKTMKMAYICKYDVCNQHCAVVYLFLRLFWHLKKGNLSKHVCRFELFKISIQYPTSMNVHWTRGLRL